MISRCLETGLRKMAQKITDIVQRQKNVEKSIILFKVLYHYLNMMPIKIQFELSLKLFACIYFFFN